MNRLVFILLFVSGFATLSYPQQGNYSVFSNNRDNNSQWLLYKNNNEALYKIITSEALTILQERSEKIKELQTQEEWLAYQNNIKTVFDASLEKFEKTPLQAKITGTIKRENFTVEKIIFESHPAFYVTGCVFLPRQRQNPAPAVIYVSGHTELGFRSETYQQVILNLVKKGFIVFAIDPIGQGERLQYPGSENGKSEIGGSTTEHSYAGAQTLITGTSLSDYFIWDGVRAVDYLETRKEVDAKRIGITGRSGGGTQTALIAAYDDRIYAAAPECYITNFARLLQSIGPQDAEQNPYHFIKNGLDHPDFLHMRAPKPALILTTTHDFFSQQGARETFAEVQKSYLALGQQENIQFAEDFGVHESTKQNRETVYAFFQKHLNNPGDNTDHSITPFSPEELWVTSTGQAGTSLKGETVFSLNQKYFSKKEPFGNELQQKIKETAGIDFNRRMTAAVYTGKIISEGFEIEKHFLENNRQDYALPLYKIKEVGEPAQKLLLWLHAEGKQKSVESELLPAFLDLGYTVICADLPGIGELNDPEFRGDGFVNNIPFNYTFGANLVGKSVTGIQAEALDLVVQYLEKEFPDTRPDIFAEGIISNAVLHYAALKNPFSKIVLNEASQSYKNLIQTEFYHPEQAFGIPPGCLSYYDINDLILLLPENSVKQINILNPKGEIIANQKTDSQIISLFR